MLVITDDLLIRLYERTACALSYYNFAEGADTSDEVDARTLARHAYYAAKSELLMRKLEIPKGPWLV